MLFWSGFRIAQNSSSALGVGHLSEDLEGHNSTLKNGQNVMYNNFKIDENIFILNC